MDLTQLDRKYYRLINQWKSVHKFPGDTTRKILTHGLVSLNESSIAALPTLSSVKRTIRRHKSSIDNNSVNHDSAAELQVPERYKFTLKEETFLIYDSGTGDSNCILIFCAPKCFHCWNNLRVGMLTELSKLSQNNFTNCIHAEKESMVITYVYTLLTNKSGST